MKASCLLELFREKEYIRIEKHLRKGENVTLPPYFIVRVNVTDEIIPKMVEVIKNDDDYLCYHHNDSDYFYYTKMSDMLDFIERLKQMKKEHIYFGYGSFCYLEGYETEWIDENTQFWCKDHRVIINKEIRGERMKKEAQDSKDAMELIDKLTTSVPKELIFSDIKMKYDYDYTYTSEYGHPVTGHEEIVPTFTNMIEIFSNLIEYDLPEYCAFDGPNNKYIKECAKEIKRMEELKNEIENEYGDAVKCILGEWNTSIHGCALYVYIL